ncbi:hypothetical protein [Massilia sp. METH4]|uniref:hypothetical protein n=1 Tax=Massilia sp. METH4 TaxID=3123041 RepID=UPI0030CE911D
MNDLKDRLIRACNKLALSFDSDFVWAAHDGRILHPVLRIPELGAPNGILIFQDYDEVGEYADSIGKAGFGYAVLNEPLPDENFDLSTYREMFEDWGLNSGD